MAHQPGTLQTELGDLKKVMKQCSLSKAEVGDVGVLETTWPEGLLLKVNKNRVVSIDSCGHGGKVADLIAVI